MTDEQSNWTAPGEPTGPVPPRHPPAGAHGPPPGWWQASDGNWYPPHQQPGWAPQAPPQPTWSPQPQAQPYAYGYGYPAGQAPTTNGMAIASLVLGILWLCWVGSILALVFGYLARSQIDQSQGMQTGRGMAIAGIVLGWIGVGLFVLNVVISMAAPA